MAESHVLRIRKLGNVPTKIQSGVFLTILLASADASSSLVQSDKLVHEFFSSSSAAFDRGILIEAIGLRWVRGKSVTLLALMINVG